MFNKVRKLTRDSSGHIVPLEGLISGSTVSAPDGSFHVDNLPVGDYYVSAIGTNASHLRSSDWGGPAGFCHVTGTAADTALSLNVRTGTIITFAVDDPAGKIIVRDASGIMASETNLGISVNTGISYYSAKLNSRAGTQWLYTVAVPVGIPVGLFLSTELNVTDANGVAMPIGQTATPSLTVPDAGGLKLGLMVR
jgi:hypothetical protein